MKWGRKLLREILCSLAMHNNGPKRMDRNYAEKCWTYISLLFLTSFSVHSQDSPINEPTMQAWTKEKEEKGEKGGGALKNKMFFISFTSYFSLEGASFSQPESILTTSDRSPNKKATREESRLKLPKRTTVGQISRVETSATKSSKILKQRGAAIDDQSRQTPLHQFSFTTCNKLIRLECCLVPLDE